MILIFGIKNQYGFDRYGPYVHYVRSVDVGTEILKNLPDVPGAYAMIHSPDEIEQNFIGSNTFKIALSEMGLVLLEPVTPEKQGFGRLVTVYHAR